MTGRNDIHPNAPAGGGGPGAFRSAVATGMNPAMDQWSRPGPLGLQRGSTHAKLTISGVIVAGGDLSQATIVAVNIAAASSSVQWRRYIAYEKVVKVGGSLAWRANNPGNLRTASTKIGSVSGAVGTFAVFAKLEDGRAAQRDLYVSKYGAMKVRDAINRLTPPSENDTAKYLSDLAAAGIDLDKDVQSQIDSLMRGVEANEGLIQGADVKRIP